jgi:uncharacterized NAD-dependent epimerase/dehydratase family protein
MPIDAVVADFISGATEALSPARHDGGWDLNRMSGLAVPPVLCRRVAGLLHGAQADALVLCHQSGRTRMRHMSQHSVPSLELCLERNLEAARLTNPAVVAVGIALNTAGLEADAAELACGEAEARLGLPCQDPVRHGVGRIVERMSERFAD